MDREEICARIASAETIKDALNDLCIKQKAEIERLRDGLTRIANAADKAAMVSGLDVATALVFDELARIAASALSGVSIEAARSV